MEAKMSCEAISITTIDDKRLNGSIFDMTLAYLKGGRFNWVFSKGSFAMSRNVAYN